jgi:hypothetical protein
MIEKLNLELPTQIDNCQEKKAALQQQWLGQWFHFQVHGSVGESAFLPRGFDWIGCKSKDPWHSFFSDQTGRFLARGGAHMKLN